MVRRVNFVLNWLILVPVGAYLMLHVIFGFDHYYEIGHIKVVDPARPGQITLAYDGGPKRSFIGQYSVTVRDFSSHRVACDAKSGRFRYRPGSSRPEVITMEWWSGGDERCMGIGPGVYIMTTCWTAHQRLSGLLPPVTRCLDSNPFTVRHDA